MLNSVDLNVKLSKAEFKEKYDVLEKELIRLQREILEIGMPVMITFEGWSASGKGTLINDLSFPMDPRGFRVVDGRCDNSEISYLIPFWKNSPANGFVSIFDRSWYRAGMEDIYSTGIRKKKFIRDAINFEQHHLNSNTLVIKFFLHISKEEQSRRLTELTSSKATAWRVTEADLKQNLLYDKFLEASNYVIEKTNTVSPWVIVEAEDRLHAKYKVISTIVEKIKEGLKAYPTSSKDKISLTPTPEKDPFKKIDLSAKISQDEYKQQMSEVTADLRELGYRLFRRKIPMVVLYEGWDAAGKGGSIRRLTRFFDPRAYNVVPVAAPTKVELNHNYLWRFWTEMPKKGTVTVFDRSWYGRVLVEKVEGFCNPDDWKRAYEEINEIEKHLVDQGVVFLKFWMEISKQEQLERFERRLEIAHKRWKITDEDWRNRDKWDLYKPAVDEMLLRTSTEAAPWTIVEGNNKQFARVKTIRTVRDAIEKALS
ncbi:MAG: polyphosphate:AMP phosphotransferase [Lentisphaeraceae bacterium]|nr:polyphosphate:AMP phosphotransferase [Lentisphaeraceae bacterium]